MQSNSLRITYFNRLQQSVSDTLCSLLHESCRISKNSLSAGLIVLCLAFPRAHAATYYISPNGIDSNSGTSTSAPWQTLAKVNAARFAPGDSVLFQGGQSWTGVLVFSNSKNVPVSSPTNTITVGSYGTGTATIVSNNTGTYSAAVTLQGVSGIKLTGLKILGGGGTSPMTSIGVYIRNGSSGTTSAVTVDNCDISNFSASNSSQTAEVYVSGYNGPLNTISIINNQLHGANGVSSPDCNGIYGIASGINITNVNYSGNTVYNLGGVAKSIGGGIVANYVNGGVLQYNVAHDIGANSTSCGGPGGIWACASKNVIIQFNEVYNVRPTTYTTGCDWGAYDLDIGVTNSCVQYNYSHDNAGAAWLAFISGTWGNNTYRFNISENDDNMCTSGGVLLLANAVPTSPIYVYNNTAYSTLPTTTTRYPAFMYSQVNGTTAWPANSCILNNIWYDNVKTAGGKVQYAYFPFSCTGLTVDNNLYYSNFTAVWNFHGTYYTTLAAYQTASGLDTQSLVANPLLSAPATGGTVAWTPSFHDGPQANPTGYTLGAGSPAYSAGVNITTAPYNFTVSRDYYGNNYANAIGAAQSGTSLPGTAFLTGQTLGTLMNNLTGSMGYKFTVGCSPITVSALGRWVIAGNAGTHIVKLSTDIGDIDGASVTINTAGAAAGQYRYVNLVAPVTLAANTTYCIVSHEVSGGDQWYDYNDTILTSSTMATVVAPVYSGSDAAPWSTTSGTNKGYIPLNFMTVP